MKRWLREIALVLVVYGAYSLVRSALGGRARLAADNARRVTSLERALGLFHERTIQRLLDGPWIIRPINTFYALAHFSVTGGVLLCLFVRSGAYRRRRRAIMTTTVLALVGYAVFPLMPPRLLPGDGIVDTLAVYGAPWTYSGDNLGSISNQFAAMPSLHVAWAMWCTWAVWSETRRAWVRALAAGYSVLAMIAVIATGNHFLLDIAGAAIVVAAGIALARRLDRNGDAPPAARRGAANPRAAQRAERAGGSQGGPGANSESIVLGAEDGENAEPARRQ